MVNSKLASLFEEYMSLASKSSSSNTSMSSHSHSGIDDNSSLPLKSDSWCMDVFKVFMIFFTFLTISYIINWDPRIEYNDLHVFCKLWSMWSSLYLLGTILYVETRYWNVFRICCLLLHHLVADHIAYSFKQ